MQDKEITYFPSEDRVNQLNSMDLNTLEKVYEELDKHIECLKEKNPKNKSIVGMEVAAQMIFNIIADKNIIEGQLVGTTRDEDEIMNNEKLQKECVAFFKKFGYNIVSVDEFDATERENGTLDCYLLTVCHYEADTEEGLPEENAEKPFWFDLVPKGAKYAMSNIKTA